MSRLDGVLTCALMILTDACPPDPGMYLCRQCDADDGLCADCWRRYLFAVANGEKTLPPLPAVG